MRKNNILAEAISYIDDKETLNNIRSEFESLCEKREEYLDSINESKDIKGNSFIYIKETFENMVPSLFKTNKGRHIINKFINENKRSNDLRKMFIVCENLKNVSKSVNISDFINETINATNGIDRKNLQKGIENLESILREAYVEIGKKSKDMLYKDDNKMLNESIEYVLTNKKSLKNMPKYSECISEISKYISNKDTEKKHLSEKKGAKNIDSIVSMVNEKYSQDKIGKKTFDEIKNILEAVDKKTIFDKYKDECIKTISEASKNEINQSSSTILYELKQKLENKEYNENTFHTDLSNFIDLKETIENE